MIRHKTKWIYKFIMEFGFWLSKVRPPKFEGKISRITTFPKDKGAVRAKAKEWQYRNDGLGGIINKIPQPDLAAKWTMDDCDGYAASLYGLSDAKHKYILTYFTNSLTKWHTVFLWFDLETATFKCINWSNFYEGSLEEVLSRLKSYSKDEWRDWHVATYHEEKNRWKTFRAIRREI